MSKVRYSSININYFNGFTQNDVKDIILKHKMCMSGGIVERFKKI